MAKHPTNTGKINKKALIDALHKTGGVILQCADELGVTPQAIYFYIDRHPDIKPELEKAREKLVDIAESALIKLIKDGNVQATIFALKCQGAAKKWQEKTVIEASLSVHKAEDMALALGLSPSSPTSADEQEG